MKKINNPLYEVLFPGGVRSERGIPSICSASRYVILGAMERMKYHDLPVIIESTANQVNQFGGYTGMRPADFVELVHALAREADFPLERLVLGGDHLGPLVWKDEPEDIAMEKACQLVAEYVAAGFTKIHLDTSMRLGDDDPDAPFEVATAARRSAKLMRACEDAFATCGEGAISPLYIIGSEVPVPGGADEEELSVTTPEDFEETLAVFNRCFEAEGLGEVWNRVVAVVVQPGVEFGNYGVSDYDEVKAASLVERLNHHKGLVLEGHSTDYQTPVSLHRMARDGIVIQKVGPACTFAVREALYNLSQIESLMCPESGARANLFNTLDEVMQENPRYWLGYYTGTDAELQRERIFGFSDRCRYYMNDPRVAAAEKKLISSLSSATIPLSLISQFFPVQYRKIRQGKLENKPEALILDYIGALLDDYLNVC